MRPRNRSQRGTIIIWFTLFLMTLIGVSSLGIDMAKVMAAHTQLQNAADAAALAGASAIDPVSGKLVPDSVVVRAQQFGGLNQAFVDGPTPVVIDAADVVLVDDHTVKVTARREGGEAVVTYIAKVFGVSSLDLHADATAKVEPTGTLTCGVVPLGAVPPPGAVFQPGCNNTYILKQAAQGGTTGNYQALQFPSCPDGDCVGTPGGGSNVYRCLLSHGMCCSVSINDVLTPQTGNMSGPTHDAIQARFNLDTDQRAGICYSAYHGNGQRIVAVPLTTLPGNGSSTVTVLGFGMFFIQSIPGNGNNSTITGEFINTVVPGTGGALNPGPAVAYSLRLIE